MIRIKATERFGKLIECSIKGLKGKICAGPGARDHRLKFPSLAILPGRFTYNPMQADCTNYVTDTAYDGGPLKDVYHVGWWEGTFELRLGTKTASQRYAFECAIEELFLSGATFTDKLQPLPADTCLMRPGVIIVDVPECYGARIYLELLDGSWNNEKVFSKEWYSTLRVRVTIPALVAKPKKAKLADLKLVLTNDLETVVTDSASLPSDVETVNIDENGNLTEE